MCDIFVALARRTEKQAWRGIVYRQIKRDKHSRWPWLFVTIAFVSFPQTLITLRDTLEIFVLTSPLSWDFPLSKGLFMYPRRGNLRLETNTKKKEEKNGGCSFLYVFVMNYSFARHRRLLWSRTETTVAPRRWRCCTGETSREFTILKPCTAWCYDT